MLRHTAIYFSKTTLGSIQIVCINKKAKALEDKQPIDDFTVINS